MERNCRNGIKRIEKIIFIFFLYFSFSFSENLFLPEEEIIGIDLSLKKTEIFNIYPEISQTISFPPLPLIKLEEGKKMEEKIEKKGFTEIELKYGNYDGLMNVNYKDEKIKTGFSVSLKDSYRPNSKIFWNDFYFVKEGDNNSLDLNFATGKTYLPGPENNYSKKNKNWDSLKWEYAHFFDNFGVKFSHKYYKIEEISTNFLKTDFNWDYNDLNFLFNIEKQIFKYDAWAISQKIIFKKDNFSIGGALKYIDKNGTRFLPEVFFKKENFSIFLISSCEIPDLWEDVEKTNYREIKEERLSPEEIYKWGIKIEFKNLDLEISHSYNKIYVWEDIDKNFLYQPYKEKFWKTSFSINSQIPLGENFKFYINGEKNFFDKDVIYLPEENLDAGFEFRKGQVLVNIWNSFTGERKFIGEKISGFSVLNFEIKFVRNFEIGFGIYNILNKKYYIVPGYPEKNQRVFFWYKKKF